MNYLVAPFCLIFSLLFTSDAIAQPAQADDWENLLQFEQERRRSDHRGPLNTNTLNYDIKYHRLEWELTPVLRYISGIVTTYFEPLTSDFDQIYFDLHTDLTVNSVKYHGANCTFAQLPSQELLITLPATLPAGVLDSVTVDYEGVPPVTGFGSYATQNVCSTVPAMWTLSEPYGARDWWPCKQDLDDKVDQIDVYITTPSAYEGVSNGVLIAQTTSGSNTTYHWRHNHPIPAYLVAIAVSDYNVNTTSLALSTGSLPMVNYLYPCNSTSAASINATLQPVMQLFINLFGNYPYADEKYGHAQFGWGGGMEHTTITFMGGFSHLLIAHELAHQWFGDKVTCGSWADIWLNEGFATYLEGMTYENGLGPNTWANWKQSKINSVTSQPGGSVWVDDTTSVGRIFDSRLSYDKGALLLHMLRWKLGDAYFFQGLNNYQNDPLLAYNYARTEDLKAQLEAVSGQNLDEFFDDWFYGQGYPTYMVVWSQNAAHQLSVQLFQTPSHASVSFFEMPVPIRFNGAGQNVTLVFDPTVNGQTFINQLNFTVTSVDFDPNRWLCAKSSIVLPVELTSLSAAWNGKAVQLKWATAAEIDNQGFEVQRSGQNQPGDGGWETIGWKQGQGTTFYPAQYELEDPTAAPGCNYYRLLQINADGTEQYSQVVSAQVPSAPGSLKILPNPARQEIRVELPEGIREADFELCDVWGRLLLREKWQEPAQRQMLNLPALPAGVYLAMLRSGRQSWEQRLLLR